MKRKNGHTLDACYATLKDCPPEKAHSALAMLDMQDSLEFDIARQYLIAYSVEELAKHNQLATLRKIIESGARCPRCKLDEIIEPKHDRLKKEDYSGQFDIVEKIAFADGSIHFREFPETGMDLYMADRGDLITSKINLHQGAVTLAPRRLVCSTHYQVYRTRTPDCRSDYLCHILRSPQFLAQLIEQKSKGIKNEQGSDFLLGFEVPLPELQVQEQLIAELSRWQHLRDGVKSVLRNWRFNESAFDGYSEVALREVLIDATNGLYKPASQYGEGTPIVRIDAYANGDVLESTDGLQKVAASPDEVRKYELRANDVLLNRVNSLERVGKVAFIGNFNDTAVFESNMMRLRFDTSRVSPTYGFLVLSLPVVVRQLQAKSKRAIGQVSVNQEDVGNVRIPLPFSLTEQGRIAAVIMSEREMLLRLKRAVSEAERIAGVSISELWGTQ